MRLEKGSPLINPARIITAYEEIMKYGVIRSPRGMECRDLHNGRVTLDTNASPLTSFNARKLNLQYAKMELQWYLEADPYADWIMNFATMWQKLKQPDGRFYSNYGQYLFKPAVDANYNVYSQFQFVVNELKRDKNSRRAAMVLLQPYHLFHDNSDVVCTYAMHFAIYEDQLHMTVHMRSNDMVYGFTNDAFCFWCIYQMVYSLLQEHYLDLQRGLYYHTANSLHIYQKHYEMVQTIISENLNGYKHIEVPFVTARGTRYLLSLRDGDAEVDDFCIWLKTND